MIARHTSDGVGYALAQACAQVERTRRAVESGALDPRRAHAAVEGVHHLTSAVAGLVGALMEQVSTMATGREDEQASVRVIP